MLKLSKMKYKLAIYRIIYSIFGLLLISVFNSCGPNLPGNTVGTNCFPEGDLGKLGICLSNQQVKCPDATPNCFGIVGDFQSQAWKHLKDSLGQTDFDAFVSLDPMISGVFVPGGGAGDSRRPACSLPPLPGGIAYQESTRPKVYYASLTESLPPANPSPVSTLEKGKTIYYNYKEDSTIVDLDPTAERVKGVTIVLFQDSSIASTDTLYDNLRNHYDSRRGSIPGGNSFADLSVGADWAGIKALDPALDSPKAFKLNHGRLSTYIVRLDQYSVLRIRFWVDLTEANGIDWRNHLKFFP